MPRAALPASQQITGLDIMAAQRCSSRPYTPSEKQLQNFACMIATVDLLEARKKFIQKSVIVDDRSLPPMQEKVAAAQWADEQEQKPEHSIVFVAEFTEKALTLDQMEKRLPKNVWDAVSGQDKDLWLPSIVKHFKVLKQNNCFGPPTTVKPRSKVFVMPVLFKHKPPRPQKKRTEKKKKSKLKNGFYKLEFTCQDQSQIYRKQFFYIQFFVTILRVK
jgi:hypothetical protein